MEKNKFTLNLETIKSFINNLYGYDNIFVDPSRNANINPAINTNINTSSATITTTGGSTAQVLNGWDTNTITDFSKMFTTSNFNISTWEDSYTNITHFYISEEVKLSSIHQDEFNRKYSKIKDTENDLLGLLFIDQNLNSYKNLFSKIKKTEVELDEYKKSKAKDRTIDHYVMNGYVEKLVRFKKIFYNGTI